MNIDKVILPNSIISRDEIAEESQSIVMCFGHFNVIHPGHLRFLGNAKEQGDVLVVAVQGDDQLSGSSNQRYYSEAERSYSVAALNIVDKVVVMHNDTIDNLIFSIKPNILVLGKEYEFEKPLLIQKCIDLVEINNGRVLYNAGEVHYSSGEILHASLDEIEKERIEQFKHACLRCNISVSNLQERVSNFSKAKILVLGDTIVDQYVVCDPVGMTAEAPIIVVKEIESKEFVGGAGIVAKHVSSLGAECHFLSVVGEDKNSSLVEEDLKSHGVLAKLIHDESRPTTFKIRYMVDSQKLFRVSRLKEHKISKKIEEQVIEQLRTIAPIVNAILVSDFVYGVITDRIIEEILLLSEIHHLKLFGDLQCSSQVGNVGKFNNFYLISPTEREARISLGNQEDGVEWVANQLMQKTKSKNLILKLGERGFIAYQNSFDSLEIKSQYFPALTTNPIDVTGAGDSLIAAMAVAVSSGSKFMEGSAISAAMAALAVRSLGNTPVGLDALKKFINKIG